MQVCALLFATLALQPGTLWDGHDLSPDTKPILLPAAFMGLRCLTANDYPATLDPKPKGTIRAFRYTYRADFGKESMRLEKLFLKEGWTLVREATHREQLTLERKLQHKLVSRQALIISASKAVLDPKAPERTRIERVPGWVRVSYNEEYRGTPPAAKVIKRGKEW